MSSVLCRVLCVLFFVAWTAERSADEMYYGGWRSLFSLLDPLFESAPVVHLMAWQILLLLIGPLCVMQRGAWRRRAWPMDAAILATAASIALAFAWGMARGGSAYQAYYQLRWPLTTLYVSVLLICVVRTPTDVRALGRTILAAALVRASLSTYFYFAYVRRQPLDPFPLYITSHDDSLLYAGGMVVVLAWAVAARRWTTWLWFTLLSVWIAAGITTNNRRIAWIELASMVAFAYLLLRDVTLRRKIHRVALVAAPVLIVYVSLGWGRGSPMFAPVRAISTTLDEQTDISSKARTEENLNLVWTYQQNPLLGEGWGHGYKEVSSTYTQGFGPSFWQYPYLPHNSLVAVATFSGAIGLGALVMLLSVAAFLGARGYRFARTPTERAAAMAAVCYLPAWTAQAFGDIGLQSLTGGLVLAIAFASASRVATWTGAWGARARSAARQLPVQADAGWAA